MLKLFRAVTALLVTLALATCSPAFAQSTFIGQGSGELPPNEWAISGAVSSAANLWSVRSGGYRSFVVQFTSVGSGNSVVCEGSNDNTNWLTLPVRQFNNLGLDPVSAAFTPTTGTFWGGDVDGSFFRCRVSTYGSGTIAGRVRLTAQLSKFQQVTLTANTGLSGPWNNARVYGVAQSVATTITRPANTTTYTANTAWANATSGATFATFSNICRAADGEVLLTNIDIQVDENPATKLQGILWLFRGTPTAINDNATFTIAAADAANLVGSIAGFPFTLVNNGASGAVFSSISLTGTPYQARCNASTNALYGMVQVVNAYVPTSGEVMTIKLSGTALN